MSCCPWFERRRKGGHVSCLSVCCPWPVSCCSCPWLEGLVSGKWPKHHGFHWFCRVLSAASGPSWAQTFQFGGPDFPVSWAQTFQFGGPMVVLRALPSKYACQVGPGACQRGRFACPAEQIQTSSGPQRMPTWSFCVPCRANAHAKWALAHAIMVVLRALSSKYGVLSVS